jgi:predicted ribosomally synthesized peptide with nif11-like leader
MSIECVRFISSNQQENIMSVEQARLFIERMKSDEAFAKRVMAIEDVAGRLACIQSEGFACNEAEIKEVLGELTDAELDSAAGGGIFDGWKYEGGWDGNILIGLINPFC